MSFIGLTRSALTMSRWGISASVGRETFPCELGLSVRWKHHCYFWHGDNVDDEDIYLMMLV